MAVLIVPDMLTADADDCQGPAADAARECYRQGPNRIEVIVADNNSTDETPRIAAAWGCHVAHVPKRLIAGARNGGAAAAHGEIVAFADADFRLHPETFNYIDAVMPHPGYVGGATGITMERWSPPGASKISRR
jgi:glycosyltransferase involved in cell wall biosynthesis